MSDKESSKEEFSFKSYFVPFTITKAIHWIIFIGLIVFFNSLFNGFVADDFGQIVDNQLVHSIKNIPAIFSSSTFNIEGQSVGIYYKPFLLLTYSIIYSFFGATPFFFHLFQVIIFILNDALIFLLFRKLINKNWAFLLAIIFLIHPINEEVAVYIASLQDTMFLFFGLLALVVSSLRKFRFQSIVILVLLSCSVLSKETGIAFVFINLIYRYLLKRERLKETLLYSVSLTILYIFAHYLAVGITFATPQAYHISRLPILERLLNIPEIIIFYLRTLILPNNLAISYDWIVTKISLSNFYLPIVIILLLSVFVARIGYILKQKNSIQFRVYLFFVLWFLLGLCFHLQFIPLDGTVAARWFYLPFVGLLGVVGVILQSFVNLKKHKTVLICIFVVITIALATTTVIRNTYYKDNLTIVCHDANELGNNFSLENACGVALFRIGKYDEAQQHLEKAVRFAPYYGSNWSILGTILGAKAENNKDKKLFDNAVADLNKSIKIEPNNPSTYDILGYLYLYHKDSSTSKIFLTRAVKKFPDDYRLWQYLAMDEYKSGNHQLALEAIKNAYLLDQNDTFVAQFYYDLANKISPKIGSKFFIL